jgi:hypothetical protein
MRRMSSESFAAAIDAWVHQVEGAMEAVFRESAQELVEQLNDLAPVDTGFLRASLRASNQAMPMISEAGSATPPGGQIELVIAGTELGEVLYLGYTASYAPMVHYGTSKMQGRPWVDMVAQRWSQIVSAKSAEIKAALGL